MAISRDQNADALLLPLGSAHENTERGQALAGFAAQATAREAHPTIEHFLPLLVATGAAGEDAATKIFEGFQHSLSTSAFAFGEYLD